MRDNNTNYEKENKAMYEQYMQEIENYTHLDDDEGLEGTLPENIKYKRKSRKAAYRRKMEQREKKKLELLSKITWRSVEDKGDWKKRVYRNRSKYLKNQSNRKVRRTKGYFPEGSTHHKVYNV